MPIVRNCLAACAVLVCFTAQAQVLRCTDARTGQVTYTDGTCPGAASVREVEPRKTPQEIQLEREQAAQALARKQQQLQAEAVTRQIDADRDARRERELAAGAPRPAARPQDYARSAECARSRRNLDVVLGSADGTYEQNLRVEAAQRQVDLDCLGPEGYAEVEKARAGRQMQALAPHGSLSMSRSAAATAPDHALQRVSLLRQPGQQLPALNTGRRLSGRL